MSISKLIQETDLRFSFHFSQYLFPVVLIQYDQGASARLG